jgi:hypothetical protein
MIRTINLTTNVPPDREVRLILPNDVPVGPAEVVVIVASQAQTTLQTLGDLLQSEFFGMWRDRTDIGDSADFARQLRDTGWARTL